MDYVLAKITTHKGPRNEKMKTIITDATLYQLPDAIENSVVYSAETLIDECEWYKLDNFSHKDYFPEFLKTNKECIEYTKLNISDADSISYFCSCQNKSNEFYFQKVSKSHLATKDGYILVILLKYRITVKTLQLTPIQMQYILRKMMFYTFKD